MKRRKPQHQQTNKQTKHTRDFTKLFSVLRVAESEAHLRPIRTRTEPQTGQQPAGSSHGAPSCPERGWWPAGFAPHPGLCILRTRPASEHILRFLLSTFTWRVLLCDKRDALVLGETPGWKEGFLDMVLFSAPAGRLGRVWVTWPRACFQEGSALWLWSRCSFWSVPFYTSGGIRTACVLSPP